MYKELLGSRIRKVRKELFRLTLEDFARKVGSSNSFMSQAENGKTSPGPEILNSICQEFSINGHWLLTGEGQPQGDSTSVVSDSQVNYRVKSGESDFDPRKSNVDTVLSVDFMKERRRIQNESQQQERIDELEGELRICQAKLEEAEKIFTLLQFTKGKEVNKAKV